MGKRRLHHFLPHFLGRNQASVYSPCDLPRSEARTSL